VLVEKQGPLQTGFERLEAPLGTSAWTEREARRKWADKETAVLPQLGWAQGDLTRVVQKCEKIVDFADAEFAGKFKRCLRVGDTDSSQSFPKSRRPMLDTIKTQSH